jgi:hypothetical protein
MATLFSSVVPFDSKPGVTAGTALLSNPVTPVEEVSEVAPDISSHALNLADFELRVYIPLLKQEQGERLVEAKFSGQHWQATTLSEFLIRILLRRLSTSELVKETSSSTSFTCV